MSNTSRGTKRKLNRDTVVVAAIDYADEHGLDELSMRRLAEVLDVTPMALYNHVANREALIDAMVEHLVGGIESPEVAGDWMRELRARILAARAVLQRHSWMQGAIETRTVAGPAVLAHMDALMAIMFDGGLSADLVHHAMHALSTRMWGITRDVLPTPALPEEPQARAEAMAGYAAQYPAIIRMASDASRTGDGCDSDAEFAFALDLLLGGFERLHAAGWTPTSW